MTHFQKIIDQSIVPSLVNHTIPLDLKDKQIVFFQLDEQAKSVTAPLVASAINMLLIRNLNANVQRTNCVGFFVDEFDSISLPNVSDYINKMRSYGLVAMLSYQSDAQVYHRYSREYAISILSSCTTKIYFNPGHQETAERISKKLGEKEVKFTLTSRSYGGRNPTRNISEQIRTIPIMKADKITKMKEREAIIVDHPGYNGIPYKKKFKNHRRNNILWRETLPSIWFKEIKPYREQKIAEKMDTDIDVEIGNREVIAESNMPSEQEIKVLQKIAA